MKLFITIIFSLLLVGCPKNEKDGFTSLSKGNLFGAGDEGFKKENIVISSQVEWKSFLLKLDSTNKASETFENAIDFSKEMIVVVIDKVRNTGGFSIEIIEAIKEGDTFLIKIKSTSPKPMDMVTMAIIQPYHIVKINKTKKEVKFIEL
ncbi:protease complex subunit PrcB family protein [Polaribacter sp. IC073]|uniref:protease complex subunit PrcB family protein n=1 Tax=Polaribacter sp. IC073 TaxID=2508540 RepID=UPI0011BD4F6F|nr:protease complex subunit PrcB family protein [Polaribacter sp. IC073]TXD48840.1 protease complex subunit PrcB family protein [Polaribacter sp. IC073]